MTSFDLSSESTQPPFNDLTARADPPVHLTMAKGGRRRNGVRGKEGWSREKSSGVGREREEISYLKCNAWEMGLILVGFGI
jgi:hypothetical protein